jgi:hypothetical protein
MTQFESLLLNTALNDKTKAELYLLQNVRVIRARAKSAGAEATKQLSACTLASVYENGKVCFFVDINRVNFIEKRFTLAHLDPDLESIMVCGREHEGDIGSKIIDFYRKYFYGEMELSDWKQKLDIKAFTIAIRSLSRDLIVAAQTVYFGSTVLGDRLMYIALIAVSDVAPTSESTHIERPSRFLASELTNIVLNTVAPAGVVHVVVQSVGYKYANHAGRILQQQSKAENVQKGRHYWNKHCKHMPQAILIGAQLSLLKGFVENDCGFMYNELRRTL